MSSASEAPAMICVWSGGKAGQHWGDQGNKDQMSPFARPRSVFSILQPYSFRIVGFHARIYYLCPYDKENKRMARNDPMGFWMPSLHISLRQFLVEQPGRDIISWIRVVWRQAANNMTRCPAARLLPHLSYQLSSVFWPRFLHNGSQRMISFHRSMTTCISV